jgi:phosphoglycolate phosphatase
MNFNYKHIIWDWNGTMLNDSWLCVQIINELLAKRNMQTISMQKYQDVFGFPVKDFYEKIGFNFSEEPFHIPATEYNDEYNRRRFQCALQNGVTDVLSHFRRVGLAQSLLSASQKSALEEAVEYYSLQSYFSFIYGLDDHYAHSKVEIANDLFRQIGLPDSDVLLVGDTTHDFEVAQSLGIDCILFCGGHHSKKKLELCNVPVIESYLEILNQTEICV